MQPLPLRLVPGDDLRRTLERAVAARACEAACVLSGIGSLVDATLRLAGSREPMRLPGDTELLMLSGTIGPGMSHLHACVADAQGRVLGGHVAYGCVVRTTAEILLALLDEWTFSRMPDPATGYDELVVQPRFATGGA